jgi:hypothetical protein
MFSCFVFMRSRSPHLLAPAWLAAVFQISLKITPLALLLNASTTDLLAARRQ